MKTFNQVISQATASDNQLKSGVFTTKLKELYDSDELSVEFTSPIVINGTQVNPACVVACALEPAMKKGSETSIATLIGLWSKDYVSPLQAKCAGDDGKKEINPLSDSERMSAEKYKGICFQLGMDRTNAHAMELLFDKFTNLSEKERTKTNFEVLLTQVFETIFPSDKRSVYQTKVNDELEAQKEFKTLSDLGIKSISKNGKEIIGLVPVANVQSVIPKIDGLGFTLVAANEFIAYSMSIKLVLSKKTEEKIINA